jgi:hypothetical protein
MDPPEVEVTETILYLTLLSVLASHKRGFFSYFRFPSTIGLAFGFLSHSWEGGWMGLV